MFSKKEKLHIGFLIDNRDVSAWIFELMKQIQDSSHSEISCVFVSEGANYSKNKNKPILLGLYEQIDRFLFKGQYSYLEKRKLNELSNIEFVHIQDVNLNENEDSLNLLRNHSTIPEIDILINLSDDNINTLSDFNSMTIWSLHFGDIDKNTGSVPSYWETNFKWDKLGISLLTTSAESEEHNVICKNFVLPDRLSLVRSLNKCHWKAVGLVIKNLEDYSLLGENEFLKRIERYKFSPNFYSNEEFDMPTNWMILKNLVSIHYLRVKNIIINLFKLEQWSLLFLFTNDLNTQIPIYKFKKILPPIDRFWADPHTINKGGVFYIFIEELIYKENKGFISVIKMDEFGNWKEPIKVLEEEFHLSFPFIIQDEGELYMIPESKENKDIRLYKCVEFPYKWEFEMVLMDNVLAVDSVIHFFDNKYWLFTNLTNHKEASGDDELYVFSSSNLLSTRWEKHNSNPVVRDLENARMAGNFFSLGDKLFRPSQSCAKVYGHSIVINEVEQLNDDMYIEKKITSIKPNWEKSISATHSLSISQNLIVIDAKVSRWRHSYKNK